MPNKVKMEFTRKQLRLLRAALMSYRNNLEFFNAQLTVWGRQSGDLVKSSIELEMLITEPLVVKRDSQEEEQG